MANFPDILTAEMLSDFETTERGCTHPRVGEINGCRFIAKCGDWSAYSSDDHVHNELVADKLLRDAGFNVPASREYRVEFCGGRGSRTVRLAEFVDAQPLLEVYHDGSATLRDKIRAQTIASYPMQVFIAGIDTFTYDNVLVDRYGKLWFVDNGASFDYRACGKKKGWYWLRNDPSDAQTGYLSLARHPSQRVLQAILGTDPDAEVMAAAKGCDFVAWAAKLPSDYQRPSLRAFVQKMACFFKSGETAENAG